MITVLGLGADPRIYGEPRSYTAAGLMVEESPVLTYLEQPSDPDALLFVLQLFFDLLV